MTNIMGETECPGCDKTFVLDDGKDERKYRNHMEGHIEGTLELAEKWRGEVNDDEIHEPCRVEVLGCADQLEAVIEYDE